MNELTDEQICNIALNTESAEPGRDGYILPVAFARAVIAADRELQDAKLTNAPTDNQINDALKVFACTVIGADRAIKDARWLEELRAYELTASNLRAEIAGRGVPDGWRLAPVEPDATQIMAAAKAAKQYFDERGGSSPTVIYRAMITAAPQPPAQCTPDIHAIFWEMRSKLLNLPRYSFFLNSGGGVGKFPNRSGKWVEVDDAAGLCEVENIDAMIAAAPQPPAQPERKPTNRQDREGIYLAAEGAIRRDENLSWRSAIVSEVEAFHGIKELK